MSLSAATDSDSLNDWAELNTHLSNPTLTDSDAVAMGYHPGCNENPAMADAEASVTNNPAAFGLYTSNSILGLGMGELVIIRVASNGHVRLQLQLEQTEDLTSGVWSNAGDAVIWTNGVPAGKAFYRVRGE